MSCHDLDRWLNEGEPDSLLVAARAHALDCPRCAARLRGWDELERTLALAPGRAPAHFVSHVMARVAGARQVPLAEVLPLFQTVPWWARVAFDPAAVLAAVVVSLVAWRGEALLAMVVSGAIQLTAWQAQLAPAAEPAGPGAPSVWLQPMAVTCAALAAAPLAVLSSRLLFDWSSHLVGPRRVRHGR